MIKEFQALGLDISIIDNNDEVHDINDLEESDDDIPITIDEIDVNKDLISQEEVKTDIEYVPDEENDEEDLDDENPNVEELEAISEGNLEGDDI